MVWGLPVFIYKYPYFALLFHNLLAKSCTNTTEWQAKRIAKSVLFLAHTIYSSPDFGLWRKFLYFTFGPDVFPPHTHLTMNYIVQTQFSWFCDHQSMTTWR